MEGIPAGLSRKSRRNLLEGRELPIQCGYRSLQHLAVAGILGCPELLRKPFP
jgi:hypothetical protein